MSRRAPEAPERPAEGHPGVPVVLPATDGYPLGARVYRPRGEATGARVVVASATATPQHFYRKFANFLADRGHEVVTFDYRGVGASRPSTPLDRFEADFVLWGERDLEGVLQWSADRGATAVVGHSYGGHAYGIAPSAPRTLGAYIFGTGTGHHAVMPLLEQPKVLALWNLVGPALLARYGYLPSRFVGLGEDLPPGVFRDWRRWCALPRNFFDDPAATFTGRFRAIARPIVGVNATDDRWAPPVSGETLLRGYSAAALELRVADARAIGPCGHMGYFRAGPGRALWPDVDRWLRAAVSA